MIRSCLAVGLLLAAVVVVGAVPRAEAEPAKPPAGLRLGILSGMFRDVPPELVQAVATPFQQLFKRQTGLDGEIVVVPDHDALAAQLDDKTLQFGVFHGFEWAWARGSYPNLRPLVITTPPGKTLHACLVVPVGSKAAAPADLTEPVAVPLGTKAYCHLYLDRLRAGLPAGACKAETAARGTEEVLDGVATGKTAAAVVDAATLDAYVGNRPGPGARIKVLAKSEPFPPAVVVYRDGGVDAAVVPKVRAGLIKANGTPQGKAFMVLWKLKGFETPTDGYDADLAACLKAYPPSQK